MGKKVIEERGDEQLYWIIKTTEGGPSERDHWEDFKRDQVIAVGWTSVKVDPTELDYHELLERFSTQYGWEGPDAAHAASTIYSFTHSWRKGDIAVICEGYSPNQSKDVLLHGFAVVGDFSYDLKTRWGWRLKRKAKLRNIGKRIPKRVFADAFEMGSMLMTIHGPFLETQFRKFSGEVQRLYPKLWCGVTTGYPIRFREKKT